MDEQKKKERIKDIHCKAQQKEDLIHTVNILESWSQCEKNLGVDLSIAVLGTFVLSLDQFALSLDIQTCQF